MHNLSLYYGLVDAKIRASDKDLPVTGNTRETHSDIKLMPYDGKWGYILNQLSDQRLAFLKSFGR